MANKPHGKLVHCENCNRTGYKDGAVCQVCSERGYFIAFGSVCRSGNPCISSLGYTCTSRECGDCENRRKVMGILLDEFATY